MGLPNLTIILQNGLLGRASQTSDGVAGMILTGAAVTTPANEANLQLNKVYTLSSLRDLTSLGVTAENNPLVYKDVSAFYEKKGDGAELYLLVVAAATTLTQMCSSDPSSPIHKLIAAGGGRIRLVGLNRVAPEGYESTVAQTGIDNDAVLAGAAINAVANAYAKKVSPFRVLLPAMMWNGLTENLYKPRQSTFNRVGYVMASDAVIGEQYTAAIGQFLGMASAVPVHYPVSRVKNGIAALTGYLTNGKTPEENDALLDALHDAGYILYRKFATRNGYYFSSDAMAAPLSDDYSNLYLGRTIDKAMILVYDTYIDEIEEVVDVDDDGHIPVPVCKNYESTINSAVAAGMQGEISNFSSYIDPAQDILTTSLMTVAISVRPKGVLRDIKALLGFENPSLKQ